MQPLDGVRVVDLTRALSGPLCAMILGDLGADVIKIEQPGVGDDTRHWGPPFQNGQSAYFLSCNRNKRDVALNLKSDAGREVLWRLIERGDVLIENFRPGLIARLGFPYEAVHTRNPRLVYCSISGFGQDGPDAQRAAYDIILQGMSGVSSISGDPAGPPMRSGLPVADVLAGLFAAQGILAALLARERTGEGQKVETTMLGATVAALGNYVASYLMTGRAPGQVGNSHPQIAPYDLIRTAGGHLYIACGNDDIWRRFCAALDLGALLDDPRYRTNFDRVRHRTELVAAIEERTTRYATAELLATLDAAGVPAGPIHNLRQVFESQGAQHIGLGLVQRHPVTGDVHSVSSPLHLSATPIEARLPPPPLGEHTEAVLRELGFDDTTISAWHADGTVASPE